MTFFHLLRLKLEETLNILVPWFLPVHVLLIIDDEAPIDRLNRG